MTPSATSAALDTVKRYYALIDGGDAEQSYLLFAEDAVVRFGDHPELSGRDAIADRVRTMVALGRSVEHVIKRSYEVPGPEDRTTVICEVTVTYVMLRSGNVIPHNGVTIHEVDLQGRIVRQRNVGDLRPVIEDHAAHA
ncbi:MAG TPA: nuclear transport factor 2 family protein [Baekduia sp.]|uniref:nuclear transport factor 2 family protein n=1 Tax=Baekduia sp. TaxID=2600305 RepID=UPI002D79CFB8|nr:nuclear transport factor 2 family protein [Baekduia sp.]HET6509042.1 nuclear transport factor 2 family protein [Baekduia sp.]